MTAQNEQRLNSSLRVRSLADTLKLAKALAPSRGITRVTDTTPLDRIGIPVYASMRPGAAIGSLCVNAGKGLLPAEAQIGAYMEAIEFSFAEEGGSHVQFKVTSIEDMLSTYSGAIAFSDFCPLMGLTGHGGESISVVEAELVGLDSVALVPAELVFLPFKSAGREVKFCRGTSNGLASGNSIHEASVHALAEIIERDIAASQFICNTSRPVSTSELPPALEHLVQKVERADLQVVLRTVENCFGLPYFHAVIMEKREHAAVSICGGYGVHPIKEVAAVRALAEAAQSRLSIIHGGRDDLIKYPETWADIGREEELLAIAQYRAKMSDASKMVVFEDVEDLSATVSDVDTAWDAMTSALGRNEIHHIARVVFTEPHHDLHVVKLIVPKMEQCSAECMRFGPRIRAYINGL
jgi:ribosomal protein S12 methylthiotransferase accessory factor